MSLTLHSCRGIGQLSGGMTSIPRGHHMRMTSWHMSSVIAKQAIHTASVAFPRTPLQPPLRCLPSTLKGTSTSGVLAPPLQPLMRLGGHSTIMRWYLSEKLNTCHLPGILWCWKVLGRDTAKIRSCTVKNKASNLFCWMMITVIATHLWALVTLCV